MKIAPLRDRLDFQTKEIVRDEIGNESSIWNPLFSRWCSCRPLVKTETDGIVTKLAFDKLQFTLRYDCSVLELDSLTTKLQFRGLSYSIDSIDGDTVPRELIYIVATREVGHGKDLS